MNNCFHHGHHGRRRGRSQLYTDQTICTFLMLKGIFNLTLRAPRDYSTPCSSWMNVPLCFDYQLCQQASALARWRWLVDSPLRGASTDLVIDSTGLKVFG